MKYLFVYIYIHIYIHTHISPNSFSYRGSYFKLEVRVRRFCGFVAGGGLSHRESFEVSSGVCVGVTVRLSHRVSLEVSSGVCRGQGSQIQDRAVVTGCCWRCNLLMCVGVRGLQI